MRTYTFVLKIAGGILSVAGIVVIIIGLAKIQGSSMMGFLLGGGFALLLGIIVLIMGLAFGKRVKLQYTAIDNPNSFAYLTYGKHGNFKHFVACINKEAQQQKSKSNNAIINTLGVVSAFTIGAGFFSFSLPGEAQYIDMFISDDELAFCDARTHRKDEDFIRIPASAISGLNIQPTRKGARALISLYDQEYMFTIDIFSKKAYSESVVEAFGGIKKLVDENNEVFPVHNQKADSATTLLSDSLVSDNRAADGVPGQSSTFAAANVVKPKRNKLILIIAAAVVFVAVVTVIIIVSVVTAIEAGEIEQGKYIELVGDIKIVQIDEVYYLSGVIHNKHTKQTTEIRLTVALYDDVGGISDSGSFWVPDGAGNRINIQPNETVSYQYPLLNLTNNPQDVSWAMVVEIYVKYE